MDPVTPAAAAAAPFALTRRLAGFDARDVARLGQEIYDFAAAAYPICRSITGDGVRQTLALLAQVIPLTVHEVPSGTPVFDWTVPPEWNLRAAYVQNALGERVIDVAQHTLHILNYSVPVRQRLSLAELKAHLYSLPEQPEAIPYRTSYYQERWGFCLSHRQLESLPEGDYDVLIDASLEPGHLTYGEFFLPGKSADTVLFSAHICHPSLANDNLSGVGVCALLARELSAFDLHYSYRFLFIPGTIGAITWLALHEAAARQVRHGLVAANLGDPGPFHYKKTRRGQTELDRVVLQVLAATQQPFQIEDFVPFGYDERQYASPGFNLAVGSLTRTPWGRYPEYHTSNDNLSFIQPHSLGESLRLYLQVVHALEHNQPYWNCNPCGEPQLGRRGLYNTLGGRESGRERELALLWVLNLSDGEHTVLDIVERSGLSLDQILAAVEALLAVELLRPLPQSR